MRIIGSKYRYSQLLEFIVSFSRTEAICERARALQLRNGHKLKLHLLVMSLEAFGLTLFRPFFIKNDAIKMTTHFDLSKALTAKKKRRRREQR